MVKIWRKVKGWRNDIDGAKRGKSKGKKETLDVTQ